MDRFEILITSSPDRERLVAEIWYNNMFWVELSQESEELVAQFYSHPTEDCWEFSFDEAMKMLEKAKNRLLEL